MAITQAVLVAAQGIFLLIFIVVMVKNIKIGKELFEKYVQALIKIQELSELKEVIKEELRKEERC